MVSRVTVYNGRIVSLVQVGDGDRWVHGEAKGVERVGRVLAPKRSGRLAASHVTLPTRGTNQYQKVYRVSAMAYYAQWVHGGTGIYGPEHRMIDVGHPMRIPGRNPNVLRVQGRSGTVVQRTKGQRPQPWLERAAEIALRV